MQLPVSRNSVLVTFLNKVFYNKSTIVYKHLLQSYLTMTFESRTQFVHQQCSHSFRKRQGELDFHHLLTRHVFYANYPDNFSFHQVFVIKMNKKHALLFRLNLSFS
jgi:hypothetical protein